MERFVKPGVCMTVCGDVVGIDNFVLWFYDDLTLMFTNS